MSFKLSWAIDRKKNNNNNNVEIIRMILAVFEVFVSLFCFVFQDRILLCSFGACPGVHSVDQVDLQLIRSAFFCLPSAETKGVYHHHQAYSVHLILLMNVFSADHLVLDNQWVCSSSCSHHSLVACSSWCRVGASWLFPIHFGTSIAAVLIHLRVRQPCW